MTTIENIENNLILENILEDIDKNKIKRGRPKRTDNKTKSEIQKEYYLKFKERKQKNETKKIISYKMRKCNDDTEDYYIRKVKCEYCKANTLFRHLDNHYKTKKCSYMRKIIELENKNNDLQNKLINL